MISLQQWNTTKLLNIWQWRNYTFVWHVWNDIKTQCTASWVLLISFSSGRSCVGDRFELNNAHGIDNDGIMFRCSLFESIKKYAKGTLRVANLCKIESNLNSSAGCGTVMYQTYKRCRFDLNHNMTIRDCRYCRSETDVIYVYVPLVRKTAKNHQIYDNVISTNNRTAAHVWQNIVRENFKMVHNTSKYH